MKIIYRLYELVNLEQRNNFFNDRILLYQGVMESKSLDDFKSTMKKMYGNDLKFRKSTKSAVGDVICTIISTDCYNPDDYMQLNEYTCNFCKKKFKTTKKEGYQKYDPYVRSRVSDWKTIDLSRICPTLWEQEKNIIITSKFCNTDCMHAFAKEKEKEYKVYNNEYGLVPNEWVHRESSEGYIYKITKKSTQESYVGMTDGLPIFRWGQHLKTERFHIENIHDYTFEVLEVVEKDQLRQREAYHINQLDKLKALNKIIPIIKNDTV